MGGGEICPRFFGAPGRAHSLGAESRLLTRQWAWPLVEPRKFAHARSLPRVLVRPHGVDLAAGYTSALLVGFMNCPNAYYPI
jgi:hypothetical protein